jgi:hypothetical protein
MPWQVFVRAALWVMESEPRRSVAIRARTYFDQFSTVNPLNRVKFLSFVVASTRPFTWAIAAI